MDKNDPTKHKQQQLRAGLLIERLCDQLEAGLRAAGRPSIEELLETCPGPYKEVACKALIVREIELRQEGNDRSGIAQLLKRFPGHEDLIRQTAKTAEQSGGEKLKQNSDALTAAGIQELARSWARTSDKKSAVKMARELIKAGSLTKYQAEEMLNGRAKLLTFGPYIVLEKIGQGGMGLVLRGEHQEMKRPVAIKVLPRAIRQQSDAALRFRREVEAAARLLHQNIVTAYDAGEHEGMLYLVMEFVPGSDLHSYVQEHGPLKVEEAVHCVLEAAKGLEYAHQQSVIHRDIKPANLLLSLGNSARSSVIKGSNALSDTVKSPEITRCKVKVLDMGLARIDSESIAKVMTGKTPAGSPLTATGDIMGTVDYMSPEQAIDTRSVDGRADIYALGCTLHYLLTGIPPFAGDNMVQRLMAHRTQPIPSLREARPEVSQALDDVFQRMLAKRVEDRFSTMSEVTSLLEDCLLELRPDSQRAALPKRPSTVQETGKNEELTELPSIRVETEDEDLHDDRVEQRSVLAIAIRLVLSLTFLTLVVAIGCVTWNRLSRPDPEKVADRTEDRSTKTSAKDLPVAENAVPEPATGPVRQPWTLAEALEWALGQGSARVQVGDQILELERGQQPPVEDYSIVAINVAGAKGEIDGNVLRLSRITSLRQLDFSGTELTDKGIASLVVLPRLESLDVSSCQIGAAGLKSIGQMRTLISLSIGQTPGTQNQIVNAVSQSGVPASLDDLQTLGKLESLEIGGGYAESAVLSLLKRCPGLVSLTVDSVPFSATGIASLGTLNNLTTLGLTNAGLSVRDVPALIALKDSTKLIQLNIQGNAIPPDGVRRLMGEFEGCKIFGGEFDPQRNLVREIVQRRGTVFVTAPGQSGLEISEANFNDLPEGFNLQKVDLSGVRPLPPHLLSLKEVIELNLADSAVSARSIKELPGDAPTIMKLNLSGTVVTDAEIKVLATMESLQELDVSRTRVSRSAIDEFKVERPGRTIIGP